MTGKGGLAAETIQLLLKLAESPLPAAWSAFCNAKDFIASMLPDIQYALDHIHLAICLSRSQPL